METVIRIGMNTAMSIFGLIAVIAMFITALSQVAMLRKDDLIHILGGHGYLLFNLGYSLG